MSSARTVQGLSPALASHWRVILDALDERVRAAGGYTFLHIARPLLFAAGFYAGTDPSSFLTALADAIRAVSARFLDLADFNSANAAHPPQDPALWHGVRCPVEGPPAPGLSLGSPAMARFMGRCVDALEAMVAIRIGGYSCAFSKVWNSQTGDYFYSLSAGGEPTAFGARFPGRISAFASAGGHRSFHSIGTGLLENTWNDIGLVADPGGAIVWPPAPLIPPSYGDGFPDDTGFSADLYLFPTFTSIQPPSVEQP